MVKVNKPLTHIYHADIDNLNAIVIGQNATRATLNYELFAKSLVLTSDLKRLPYLLGGKIFIWYDSHILVNIVGSALTGIGFTVVLLNGTFDAGNYGNFNEIMDDNEAVDDILLVLHGSFHAAAGTAPVPPNVPISHWDFEGKKILYDTISLLMFLDADTNVGTADFSASNIIPSFELEIDWEPINKAEMMEFLTEHIYAKQGD